MAGAASRGGIASQLIAVHGLAGSGKSVVARRLRDLHGFEYASSGAICRKVCQLLFDHEERHALNKISQAMRGIDQQVWVKAALRQVHGKRVVFDSIRYLDDAEHLRAKGFKLWGVMCPKN